jgi:hypothetical protein
MKGRLRITSYEGAAGDEHGLGDHLGDLAVLVAGAGLAVGRVQEDIRLSPRWPRPRILNAAASVSRSARDPRDLGLGDPQRGDQVVNLAGRHAVHAGLHHHGVQPDIGAHHIAINGTYYKVGNNRPTAGCARQIIVK